MAESIQVLKLENRDEVFIMVIARRFGPHIISNLVPMPQQWQNNGIPGFDNKVSLLSFYETQDCVYLQYAFGMKNHQLTVYSKRDGQVTNHKLKQLVGDELLGLSVTDDLWMYLPIPAPSVPALIKKLRLEAATFANGLSAEDVLASENPVILKFRFF